MERRWSSIRQDGFITHCHALWVGTKVVYRVTIETTITLNQGHDVVWVAAVSKAKLDVLRGEMQHLLQAIETPSGQLSQDGEFESLVMHVHQAVCVALERVFVDAGAAPDRKRDMETFVTDLLKAFGLLTSMSIDSVEESVLTNEMLRFYVLLRKFLMIPDDVQHARNKLALAVLSLEDVETGAEQDGCCCICLDAWEDPSLPTVKLPCHHVFHEGCVMAWIRQSVKCPVCRAPVGQLAVSSI
ncbi:hypothetical protein AC1031_008271 [Aphanomyces cochlioides]|nr:hypothetical protein AC1031_008271 [Aphanomyces cochlioides]